MTRWGAVGAAVVLVIVLSGCSSVEEKVDAALDSATAATASVSVVLDELDEGKALPAFADTVIGDALTELDSAESDLSQTGPIVDADAESDRATALVTIRNGIDAVLKAREDVAAGNDLGDAMDRVDEVIRVLGQLTGDGS